MERKGGNGSSSFLLAALPVGNSLFRFYISDDIFLECSTSLQANVLVNSTILSFDAVGYFHCRENSTLFYINGTQSPSLALTNCTVTADWTGQNAFQCFEGNIILESV